MILKTLLTEKPSVACIIIFGLILSTGWCTSTQEKTLYHLYVLPYKVSHLLDIYFFNIAHFMLVITS